MVLNSNSTASEQAVQGETPASSSLPKVLTSPDQGVEHFVQSLQDVLTDITALEINTMVVERITGDKFIPWDAYCDLYRVDHQSVYGVNVHESLRDRYLTLRRDLEIEYALLRSDPTSDLFDPEAMSPQQPKWQMLTAANLENLPPTQLPDPFAATYPQERLKIQQLLSNGRFLRALRKMTELKASLDCRNQALLRLQHQYPTQTPKAIERAVKTDLIYAQSVIQLDGDVMNRYSAEILDHPQREVLLQLHQESVSASAREWRSLVEFLVDLLQKHLLGGGKRKF
ncbi:hypothetical protein [Spirulina subsalsa]|uniref:hypothetical protein n=1 Tax=Spirulina subsalsa TaxID=54311 RepID=UPI002238CB9E|nr:hypothetical protein [Spirulina subsalsa]